MKKIIPILIIILLLISSCNFPKNETISEDPVVATNVSQLLTKAAQERLEQELAALATPEPETLPYPIEDEAEATAKEPESLSEAESPDSTETEDLDTESDQPASDLPWNGEPLYQESFDNGSYWNFENPYLLSRVANGQLEFTSKGSPWWTSFYTTKPELKNGYFETSFSSSNCSDNDRFGLVIRWTRTNSFYYMGVTCDGKWGFSQYTSDNRILDLLPYESNDALKDPAESKQIGILAKDSEFEFYINRQLVGSLSHDAISDAGFFGFMSMTPGSQPSKTLIDKLEVWAE